MLSDDEAIKSLFYNKNDDSLITAASVYASDIFRSLKCREPQVRIEYIRRGKPDAGNPLFESDHSR